MQVGVAQADALNPQGGLSWAVLAGFYTMCCQVKPEITPDEFVQLAMDTGTVTEFTENSYTFSLGKIIYPAAVIEALQG